MSKSAQPANQRCGQPPPAGPAEGWLSLLAAERGERGDASPPQPGCFIDLGLDTLLAAVAVQDTESGEGSEVSALAEIFYAPLDTVAAVSFRQQVFRDLDATPLSEGVSTFTTAMADVRRILASGHQLRNEYQQQAWLLAAVGQYLAAVEGLADALGTAELSSEALRRFRDWLGAHVASATYRTLVGEADQVRAGLTEIHSTLLIGGDRVRVDRFDGELDYGAEIETCFARFRQGGPAPVRRSPGHDSAELNRVDAEVLARIAQLNPQQFAALAAFSRDHGDFIDPAIRDFDREAQFYLSYLRYLEPLRRAGLNFAYPSLSAQGKTERATQTFDLVLAAKLVADAQPVVCNSHELSGGQRIVVVTGPNNGGKTTFARTLGQLHYLAKLGCPVPGREVTLALCDGVFSHFERGENLSDLRGKLEDDLVRVHHILAQSTSRSLVILNEIFSSTTVRDATWLARRVLAELVELDCLAVCVTFLDELASFGPTTKSLVAGIVPDDPTRRTFRLEARPADGRAYARVLAASYGLGHDQVCERVGR